MNIPTLHSAPHTPDQPQSAQGKVKESCRQFEAGLWRSLLEQALAKPGKAETGKGVYQYFMVQSLADKVAGQPGGFASALQAQVTRTPSSVPNPSQS